jgi:sigma-B regulation protein RsbU (phosphoserine phosphatase)
MGRTLGLRGKSVLALLATSVIVLLLAGLIGAVAVDTIRSQLGTAYARNFTLLNRERILAPVTRELALAMRFSGSHLIRQWALDESDPGKKELALREAEGFRLDFRDKSYFLAIARSGHFYFNDVKSPFSAAPRYRMDTGDASDAWFFRTMANKRPFNINVDPNVKLHETKVWLNVPVRDGQRTLGVVGTGLDLSVFLLSFINTGEPGVTPMVVDADGAIQAHPDNTRIAYNSGASETGKDKSLYGLLEGENDAKAARAALVFAVRHPGIAEMFPVTMDGKQQLLAVSYIPELKWHVLTGVDLDVANIIDPDLLKSLAVAAMALLVLVTAGFVYAVNRLVLTPLLKLTHSAQEMATGNYAVALPGARSDEIGKLTEAFGAMAQKVRHHTETLEDTVRERTQELVQANHDMVVAHKKINDSISYASMIQRAILPEQEMNTALGTNHFVLWRPRDIVGGDFYVYREVARGCLLGVVDCAGHGVPGAFMTMLARAAIDQAIDEAGGADPAGILMRTDQAMRAMLHADETQKDIATMIDAGIAYIDFSARQVTFAGAKIALYWCDGVNVGNISGGRRSLGDRRPGNYGNERFLDQAGGDKGFGFGNDRFTAMLKQHATRPLAEQSGAFATTLAAYQGSHPQRDDITVVCFRFT